MPKTATLKQLISRNSARLRTWGAAHLELLGTCPFLRRMQFPQAQIFALGDLVAAASEETPGMICDRQHDFFFGSQRAFKWKPFVSDLLALANELAATDQELARGVSQLTVYALDFHGACRDRDFCKSFVGPAARADRKCWGDSRSPKVLWEFWYLHALARHDCDDAIVHWARQTQALLRACASDEPTDLEVLKLFLTACHYMATFPTSRCYACSSTRFNFWSYDVRDSIKALFQELQRAYAQKVWERFEANRGAGKIPIGQRMLAFAMLQLGTVVMCSFDLDDPGRVFSQLGEAAAVMAGAGA